jgi:hypothetical protein
MKVPVTVIASYRTKPTAEREAAWYAQAEPELHARVVRGRSMYHVVRDVHPSDEGRSFAYLMVEVQA